MLARLPLLVGLFVLLVGCGRPVHLVDADRTATLHAGVVTASVVELHVADAAVQVAEHAAAAIRARGEQDAVVVPFGGRSDRTRPRLLMGRIDEPSIAVLLGSVGIDVGSGGFQFLSRTYDAASDGVVLVAPDPDRPGLPVTVVAANDIGALARSWRLLTPYWEPGLFVLRDGVVEFVAELRGRWPSRVVVTEDRRGAARATEATRVVTERGGVRFRTVEVQGLSRAVGEYLGQAEFARLRALAWTGAEPDEYPVEGVIYTDAASMRAALGRTSLGALAPLGADVHALVTREFAGDGGRAVAEAAVLAALGEPAHPWLLEGLGTFASRRWWSRSLDDWVAMLHGSGLAATVHELTADAPVAIDGRAARLSPHRFGPQRGALFGFLLERDGPEAMRALWRGETELLVDEELELAFHASLEALRAERADTLLLARRARYERARELRDVRGVRLLPPRAPDGLLSADGTRTLADLGRAGANAVLLPVRAFEQAARAAGPVDLLAGVASWPDEYAADRRDVELFLYTLEARRAGFVVGLQPDLLRSAWTGLAAHDKRLVTVEHWAELLTSYLHFVEHYALLGELAGIQILSLGTELGRASDTRAETVDPLPEDPAMRERVLARLDPVKRAAALRAASDAALEATLDDARIAGWSAIARRVRQIFAGLTTYSAGYSGERTRVGFWPLLDAVGTVWFPSIDLETELRRSDDRADGSASPDEDDSAGDDPGGSEDPTEEQTDDRIDVRSTPDLESLVTRLVAQLGVQAKTARRERSGLLVMGVGFPGTDGAWGDASVRAGAADADARALFLTALAVAFERTRQNQKVFIGAFLWSWPVSADESVAAGRGHLLDDAASREALKAVFGGQ